jgi:hypothetical protein
MSMFTADGVSSLSPSIDPKTGLPQISENPDQAPRVHPASFRGHLDTAPLGPPNMPLRINKWVIYTAHEIQKECERLVRVDPGRQLECEVWHQQGSGSHRYAPILNQTPALI